jgi:hypothetical protein
MRLEFSLASMTLLALIGALLVYDYLTFRGRARHMLALETVAFLAGAWFIAFPGTASELAHLVGIGRGVDFLLYPTVIWLVRESLLTRRHRYEQEERVSELVRTIAIERAREIRAG